MFDISAECLKHFDKTRAKDNTWKQLFLFVVWALVYSNYIINNAAGIGNYIIIVVNFWKLCF